MRQIEKLTFKEMQRKVRLEHLELKELTLNELTELEQLQLRYFKTKKMTNLPHRC